MIALTPIEKSSNLAAWGYMASEQVLAVKFRSGAVWHYQNVPQAVADEMNRIIRLADNPSEAAFDSEPISIGAYFAREIRERYDGVPVLDEA